MCSKIQKSGLRAFILLIFTTININIVTAIPRFESSSLLQNVLIPIDAAVGSIIYRLRASDPRYDYPLIFTLRGEVTVVSIDSLNCTRFNSVCQANVILRKRLEIGRFYDFVVNVTSVKGESASLNCSFRATNATTPIEKIFPGAPTLLLVSEKAGRNTEIGVVLAKGNLKLPRPVLLELWGSPEFGLHQRLVTNRDAEGTIVILSSLDYETRTVHHLTMLANDPWTEMDTDTRNIASWPLLVAVLDEQDTPPVFTLAPPTTKLSPLLQVGDLVLRVHAEDGDRGKPRDIRYGLVPDNQYNTFFNITEDTGDIRLIRPLGDLLSFTHNGEPILLSVIAEEVRSSTQEPPAQFTKVRLALIPPGIIAGSPTFGASEYSVVINENAPIGTVLDLPQAEITPQPGDVVTLSLENSNGTFDISPRVVEGRSKFKIRVQDSKLLDYELWHSVHCYIIAKEIGTGNFTAKAKLNVVLNDVNDNAPIFTQDIYEVSIQENSKVGTTVLRVEATDLDHSGNKIKYTHLLGAGSQYFFLDPITGVITVSNPAGLDAEENSLITFSVEAADEDGDGQTATATVVINLIDLNDKTPSFEKSLYEFILNQNQNGFTSKSEIKAIDDDISSPNNEIHYELISAVDGIELNEYTGELQVTKKLDINEVLVLRARAWDGGTPRLSSECEIRIHPPEGVARKMIFIIPGRNRDRESVLNTLRILTGGQVTIDDIRPYTGSVPGATDVSRDSDVERSVVYASVSYAKDGFIDVKRIQEILDKEQSTKVKIEKKVVDEDNIQRGGSLLWLLIFLILLAILIAIILVLCCICEGCPLYVPPKRRVVASKSIEKLVVGSGHGRESKSVQVAEWVGRREAWTPERVLIDNEVESMRRHEMERGSERGSKRIQRQQHIDEMRDQYYIREGNTDILRLITRGRETQQPPTNNTLNEFDNGKDILMKRFIDQQQATTQMLIPNINKLQTEHELLEASLRQQNILLRQLLQERERDLRLETQSLPAGTQTDQDAGTQTEPEFFKKPIRISRSDNDASASDEDVESNRDKYRRKARSRIKRRNIKTPIQEESEEMMMVVEKPESDSPKIKQTRTSVLRLKRSNSEEAKETKSIRSGSLKKEVLREISASLNRTDEDFTEDSLDDDTSPRRRSSSKQRYYSETDLHSSSSLNRQKVDKKFGSTTELNKLAKSKQKVKQKGKSTARYMEWYKNNTKNKKKGSKEEEVDNKDEFVKETVKKVLKEPDRKKKLKKIGTGPEHPLLQHSEHRYEIQYPKKQEEDEDSGIALARPPIAQKKSVFTIAYDDMHTSQLRPDSTTPPA